MMLTIKFRNIAQSAQALLEISIPNLGLFDRNLKSAFMKPKEKKEETIKLAFV